MFADREDAGRQLARELNTFELRDPLILAIPRGGIVTGAAIARELGGELDVVLSRKIRSPHQPELAIGAVGEDGEIYLNHGIERTVGVAESYLEQERQYQLQEIARRQKLFRAARPQAEARGRSVILTDDGIATGSTMIAALGVVQAHDPHEVIVAVPVVPRDRVKPIASRCDHFVCLEAPWDFWAVGQFYESFDPVEDEEVVRILGEFAPTAPTAE